MKNFDRLFNLLWTLEELGVIYTFNGNFQPSSILRKFTIKYFDYDCE